MMTHATPIVLRRLIVVLAFGAAFVPAATSFAEDADALRAHIAELEARLAERDARIAQLETQLAAYAADAQGVVTRQAQLDARERDLEVMAGAVTTGEWAERFQTQVAVRYDEARGRSVVSAGPVFFEGESLVGDFFASAVYSVPGEQAVGTPESVSLFVQGAFSGRQFEGLTETAFVVSGEEILLPVADYRQQRKRSGLAGKNRADKGDETLTFVVDVPTLRRLAEATSLEMKTPDGLLVWSREQRALLRALLTRMEATAAVAGAPGSE